MDNENILNLKSITAIVGTANFKTFVKIAPRLTPSLYYKVKYKVDNLQTNCNSSHKQIHHKLLWIYLQTPLRLKAKFNWLMICMHYKQ